MSSHMFHAKEALEFFGTQRTANGKGVTIPSQKRYIYYFDAALQNGWQWYDRIPVKTIRLTGMKIFNLKKKEPLRYELTIRIGEESMTYKSVAFDTSDFSSILALWSL